MIPLLSNPPEDFISAFVFNVPLFDIYPAFIAISFVTVPAFKILTPSFTVSSVPKLSATLESVIETVEPFATVK